MWSSIPKSSRRTSFAFGAGSGVTDSPNNFNRKGGFSIKVVICIQRCSVYHYRTFGMKILFPVIAALATAVPLLGQTVTTSATPALVPDIPHGSTVLDALRNARPRIVPLV